MPTYPVTYTGRWRCPEHPYGLDGLRDRCEMSDMPYVACDFPPEIADIDRVVLQETRLSQPDHYVPLAYSVRWERPDQDHIALHVAFTRPLKQTFTVLIDIERQRGVLEDWVEHSMYIMICHVSHPESPAQIVLWDNLHLIPDEVAEWLGVQPGWKA